ncbi:MAG: hypothetical protein K2Q24_12215 [Chitinophagaceae bacterium]|jgi:hypothetical protein|nr:hypothetical protein [Chitinophagaceae bacterium]
MRKKLLLNLIFLLFLLTAGAKDLDGIIIKGKDSIKVTFRVPVGLLSGEPLYEKIQHKIDYYDAAGKRKKLKSDDADEIQFSFNGQTIRMLSRVNSLALGNLFSSSTNIFLKLEINGPVKLFKYYFTAARPGVGVGMGGGTYTEVSSVLQKGNGTLIMPAGFGMKKQMMDYFSDCKALVEKIDSKEFRMKELEDMVNYYNLECSK